jgi:hypothetical protein
LLVPNTHSPFQTPVDIGSVDGLRVPRLIRDDSASGKLLVGVGRERNQVRADVLNGEDREAVAIAEYAAPAAGHGVGTARDGAAGETVRVGAGYEHCARGVIDAEAPAAGRE